MDQDEPTNQEGAARGGPAVPPEAGGAPKSAPINMALLELQGEMPMPGEAPAPVPPSAPVLPAGSGPDAPTAPVRPEFAPPPHERPAPEPAPAPVASTAPPGPAATAAADRPAPVPPPSSGASAFTPRREPGRTPASTPAPLPTPTSEPLSLGKVIATAALVSLVGAAVATTAILGLRGQPAPPAKGTEASSETSTPPAGSPISAADLDSLKDKIGDLAQQIDDLKGKVKDNSSSIPNLGPLHQRLESVAKTVEEIAPLAKQVETLGGRLDALDTSVKGLQNRVNSLQMASEQPEKLREKEKPAAPAESPLPGANAPAGTQVASASRASDAEKRDPARPIVEDVDSPAENAALAQGAELFKQGKFQEAYEAFSKLQASSPNDARVWYYSALSRGFATKDWQDETKKLVLKGVELEKAGTPPTAEIDKMFGDLSLSTGSAWLKYYREAAAAR